MAPPRAPKASKKKNKETQPFRFLDLPPELRNMIYGYALCHDENAGTIAPAAVKPADLDSPRPWPHDSPLSVIVNGQAKALRIPEQSEHRFHREAHVAAGGSPSDVRGFISEPDPPKDDDDDDDNDDDDEEDEKEEHLFIGHVCTVNCLHQPGLLQANRQIRTEALGIFYDINAFHLNFGAFNNPSATGIPLRDIATSWWRAIGDTNLRAIRYLCIENPYARVAIRKFTFAADRRQRVMGVETEAATYYEVSEEEARKARQESKEAMGQIEECGLFVRGIEKVLHAGGMLTHGSVRWVAQKMPRWW